MPGHLSQMNQDCRVCRCFLYPCSAAHGCLALNKEYLLCLLCLLYLLCISSQLSNCQCLLDFQLCLSALGCQTLQRPNYKQPAI